MGQEDTENPGETSGAAKTSRLGVRGSQVRILSSRPIKTGLFEKSDRPVSLIGSLIGHVYLAVSDSTARHSESAGDGSDSHQMSRTESALGSAFRDGRLIHLLDDAQRLEVVLR